MSTVITNYFQLWRHVVKDWFESVLIYDAIGMFYKPLLFNSLVFPNIPER